MGYDGDLVLMGKLYQGSARVGNTGKARLGNDGPILARKQRKKEGRNILEGSVLVQGGKVLCLQEWLGNLACQEAADRLFIFSDNIGNRLQDGTNVGGQDIHG